MCAVCRVDLQTIHGAWLVYLKVIYLWTAVNQIFKNCLHTRFAVVQRAIESYFVYYVSLEGAGKGDKSWSFYNNWYVGRERNGSLCKRCMWEIKKRERNDCFKFRFVSAPIEKNDNMLVFQSGHNCFIKSLCIYGHYILFFSGILFITEEKKCFCFFIFYPENAVNFLRLKRKSIENFFCVGYHWEGLELLSGFYLCQCLCRGISQHFL